MPLLCPFRIPLNAALAVLMLSLANLPGLAEPLRILGIGPDAKHVTRTDLAAIGIRVIKDAREINVNGETKRLEIRYGGVSLPVLLQKQGIETLDRYGLRAATILVIAKDGYRASFSWGELFNAAAGESVTVITEENGAPNPAREGDFSLRAFSDLRPGPRHVRDVVEIRIELPR
ncbi:MAG: hypothetical protein CFE31_07485 [Rhizobiales bacterium PAR1]|nr:MAG: hypothetical protein CFE31_07485 [Rhizobiales bacterium PAR1]